VKSQKPRAEQDHGNCNGKGKGKGNGNGNGNGNGMKLSPGWPDRNHRHA